MFPQDPRICLEGQVSNILFSDATFLGLPEAVPAKFVFFCSGLDVLGTEVFQEDPRIREEGQFSKPSLPEAMLGHIAGAAESSSYEICVVLIGMEMSYEIR